MIEITENTIGIWFIATDLEMDVMAHLSKRGSEHELTYRFRYYKTSGAWDGKDVKNWYSSTYRTDDTKSAVESVRESFSMLALIMSGELDEILMGDDDVESFFEKMKSRPWCHYKVGFLPQ